jgi:hypothetical protein
MNIKLRVSPYLPLSDVSRVAVNISLAGLQHGFAETSKQILQLMKTNVRHTSSCNLLWEICRKM